MPYEKISGTHVATTSSFLGARTNTWTYRPRNSVNNNEVRYACNSRIRKMLCGSVMYLFGFPASDHALLH